MCAILLTLAFLGASGSAQRVGSAGVTVALPKAWRSIPQALPPPGVPVGDPVTRIVAASATIRFAQKGCAAYAFPSTAVAVLVEEWVERTPGAGFRPRPRRFTSKTLPVLRPPAIECYEGPGGSAQFADHGRRFAAYILLGRRAPRQLAGRARAVLDTLRVKRKR